MGYGFITYELGDRLGDLVTDQSEWSQATFGSDAHRGPLGALKHLAKEAVEAQESVGCKADFTEEMADCLLLVLDASRRGGVKVMQLIEAAQKKMLVNRAREWPKPTSDEPVEHVRTIND
jgi:hypothetical protein